MGRGWHRVKGTPPGVQSFETAAYETEVIQADQNAAGAEQMTHAKEQLALGHAYPGRERSLPNAKLQRVAD